jgi:DNA ligase-1
MTGAKQEAQDFYAQAKDEGMEGIMMKNLDGRYKPGNRVGYMVKLKPTMETLDLVIVSAEWGEGKRSGWLTSYTLACIDEGEYKTIGKVATGIKELEDAGGVTFEEMTEMLQPLVVHESGRDVEVKPEVVIEVKFNEIQQSPTYESGYALRFPRLVTVRDDRDPEDISSLSFIRSLYDQQ